MTYAAARGSPRYQTPFYDGVFCKDDVLTLTNTAKKVGVQAQVFVVINDDSAGYMFDDLIDGMYINEARGFGSDMAIYTGSTTGTSRSNEVCSKCVDAATCRAQGVRGGGA